MAFHYPTTPRTRNLKRGKFAIVRHTLGLMSSIAAILFLSPPTVVIAQELGGSDQINVGIAKSASPGCKLEHCIPKRSNEAPGRAAKRLVVIDNCDHRHNLAFRVSEFSQRYSVLKR
jgi:hypothetical protein